MDDTWLNYKTLGERATAALNYQYAEAMWAMAVLVAEEFGEKDPRYCLSIDWLSHVLIKQQKYALAERFLSRSWRLKTKVLGSSQLELARTLNTIAELYYFQGKFADAEQLCRRVYEVYVQQYGHDHPNTATALSNVSLLEQTNAAARASAPTQPAAAPQQSQSGPLPQQTAPVGPTAQSVVQQQQSTTSAPVARPIASSGRSTQMPEVVKKVRSQDVCESCGNPIDGDECVRCTSTNIRVLRLDEKLT